MAKVSAFETNVKEYEAWYEKYHYVFESELAAVKRHIPKNGVGIEIGIGTGRFAVPLGISVGIEPSCAMRDVAREKGIDAIDGVAESLPLKDSQYDYVLFVTSICFLDSLEKAFSEAYRILRPEGVIVIGFIDKESTLGKAYEKRKMQNKFYKEATFYSAAEVVDNLKYSGFKNFVFIQTVFDELDKIDAEQPIEEGYGRGSFVVVRATK